MVAAPLMPSGELRPLAPLVHAPAVPAAPRPHITASAGSTGGAAASDAKSSARLLGPALLCSAAVGVLAAGPRRRGRVAARWLQRVQARAERDRDGGMMVTSSGEDGLAGVGEPDLAMAFNQRAKESLLKTGKEHKEAMTKWNDDDWEYWDVAQIKVVGGDGGHGCKSFRRAPREDRGGPDGGNGGHGGHIFLKCVSGRTTLAPLKECVHYYANDGIVGKGKDMHGENGTHRYISVPPGSVVYVRDAWKPGFAKGERPGEWDLVRFEDTGRNLVGELTKPGQILRVARGGRGGRGNRAFKTHARTAPWVYENGEKGVGRWIEIELKMVADVGIIGVPNAGKSSFLSAVTKKEAKIAAYPFTTTVPNVGFYKADEHGGITLVDVPGLIDGASEGRGMGIKFLRHIERCRTLIHMISADSEDPLHDYDSIMHELRQYSSSVASKPQVILVNKCDIPEARELLPELMKALRQRAGHSRVFDISVASRYHVDECMRRVWKWHKSIVKEDWGPDGPPSDDAEYIVDRRIRVQLGEGVSEVAKGEPVELDVELPKGRHEKKGLYEPKVEWDVLEESWRMKHPQVEEIAARTNWNFEDAHERFNRVCKATGMTEKLSAVGVQDGESVIVGDHKFMYTPGMVGAESRMLTFEMDMEYEGGPGQEWEGKGRMTYTRK